MKLAITLRWLGGGSYLDITELYGIGTSTFYDITKDVCKAIIQVYKPEQFDFDVNNAEKIQQLAREFGEKSVKNSRDEPIFGKCCGALDGWAPVLQRPPKKKFQQRDKLYSRKGYFTINVQGAILSACS